MISFGYFLALTLGIVLLCSASLYLLGYAIYTLMLLLRQKNCPIIKQCSYNQALFKILTIY